MSLLPGRFDLPAQAQRLCAHFQVRQPEGADQRSAGVVTQCSVGLLPFQVETTDGLLSTIGELLQANATPTARLVMPPGESPPLPHWSQSASPAMLRPAAMHCLPSSLSTPALARPRPRMEPWCAEALRPVPGSRADGCRHRLLCPPPLPGSPQSDRSGTCVGVR